MQEFSSPLLRLSTRATILGFGAALENINTFELGTGARCYVEEVFTDYVLDKSSSAAADGVNVVAPIAGPGRWLITTEAPGVPVLVYPQGTGADDWPALNTVLAANAGKRPVQMMPITRAGIPADWICKTPGVLPSNTVLVSGPTVRIVSSLTFSGGAVLHCIFDTGRPTNTPLTTLAAPVTRGSPNVSMTAAPAVDDLVGIQSQAGTQLRWAYYRVLAVAGVGPFTVTLDRPVLNNFQAADVVYTVPTRAHGIYIFGRGMSITGTGDTAVQFWQATDCHVFDVAVDDSAGALGDFSFEFDLGCDNCTAERVRVSRSGLGIGAASGERVRYRSCLADTTLGGLGGFDIFDCQECEVEDCEAYGCGAGVFIGSNGVNGGCQATRVRGGSFFGNIDGILVRAGSTETILEGISSRFNTVGIAVDAAGGAPSDIVIDGTVTGNGTDYSIPDAIAGVQYRVPTATSGPVELYWNNYFYDAAGTFYMLAGEAAGLPGVAGTQLATTAEWSRVKLPFNVQLEGMALYNRLENATAAVDYDLRHNNDTTSIQVITKANGAFVASSPLNIKLLAGDVLTVRVVSPAFGGATGVAGVLTVWGKRIP